MTVTVIEVELRLRIVIDLVPLLGATAPAAEVSASSDTMPAAPLPAPDPTPVPRAKATRAEKLPAKPPANARSPEERAQAVEEYRGGETLAAVAERHKVSAVAVMNWLRAAGVPTRPGSWTGSTPKRGKALPPAPSQPAPSQDVAPPSAAPLPPPSLPVTAPRDADAAAIAEAVAAGRVTRLPDPSAFAHLPGVPDSAAARQHLQRLGRSVSKSGPYYFLDGGRVSPGELMAAATAALREEAMRGETP